MNPHIRVDGQIGIEYVYVWKWKVLNPQRKICGFKNILILVDGARVSDKKKIIIIIIKSNVTVI